MKSSALFILATFALMLTVSSTGQTATGMSAMQYYVGTWTCTGGPLDQKPSHNVKITYTLDSGVLRQMVDVPAQGSMKTPFVQSTSVVYDAKHNRYISSRVDSFGQWGVSSVTLSGNTQHSVDLASSDNMLGHGTTVRTNNNTFTFTGYPTKTGTKPNFKGTCTRSS